MPLAPTIATTLSEPTSWRAAWIVCCGSNALSRAMNSTLRPLIPPSALIFSKAAVTPSFCGMPEEATGPVSGNQPPTLIGSLPPEPPPDAAPPSPPQAVTVRAAAAMANTDAMRISPSLLVPKASVVNLT